MNDIQRHLRRLERFKRQRRYVLIAAAGTWILAWLATAVFLGVLAARRGG